MMTSVTLPSTSGPLHGGYSSSVAEETTSSEPEFETPRPVKRCMITSMNDSCKKRRKQSTPVRISAEVSVGDQIEGKQITTSPPTTSTASEPDLQCPVCQLYFNNSDQLQHHLITSHSAFDLKKEPEDYLVGCNQQNVIDSCNNSRAETPLELTSVNRSEVQWMTDLQGKEWMSPNLHGLPFNATSSMFMGLPQFAQADNLSRQPIRIFNPDAYCDLCNKEFCNKYFLKTHKANKHGIYSDPPSSEPLVNNVNITPSLYAGTIKLPTTVPSVDLPIIQTDKPANLISPFNNLFTNPFTTNKSFPKQPQQTIKLSNLYESESNENVPNSNGFSSNSESGKLSPDDQPGDASSSPRNNTQTESTSFKLDNAPSDSGVYYIPQSKSSPLTDLEMANRFRRIGVMNPKAFCEICCKEYCNKYFLRTHKMKRHGIYIPDDKDPKDMKLEGGVGGASFPWQNNMQTSPLNLIMAEQSRQDRKTSTSPSDIRCDICGIKFQNASLWQLHNVSVHAKLYAKDEEHQIPILPSETQIDEIKKEPISVSEKSINAETISEDLQKLQTMILQLNELDVSKACTTCNACNKEFENRYFLHAHMMTDHGILLDEIIPDVDKPVESENSSNNNTLCDLCGKDVPNIDEMKKHLLEFHPNHQTSDQIKDEFNGFNTTPDRNPNRLMVTNDRRISVNVTPTSSYCDICNKELCNKYFMKTHMQRMHGIEIENGAQIGGVICDICNKELCSKYFLRVHKHNTHGIVEYGTSLLPPRKNEIDNPTPLLPPPEPDPALKPGDLAELSHRYFTHFTEVCSICSRRFRSTKWLKAHLLSDHGQTGADKWSELEQQLQQNIGQHSKSVSGTKSERSSPTLKIPNGGQQERKDGSGSIQNVLSSLFGIDETTAKNYQCSFCPFTTPLLPLLFVHERSHSMSSDGQPLKCPVCAQNFHQPELLQHHMLSQHPFLPWPPLFNGNNEISPTADVSKEPSEIAEEDDTGFARGKSQSVKGKSIKSRPSIEISPENGQILKEMANRTKVPAAYAIPQGAEEAGYVMQAFLAEEAAAEKRVVPAIVFLPVFQKQSTPLTVTFTLTPA